jgi:hypothetical protein
MINELEFIAKYKAGELRGQEVLDLFSYLIKTGKVWELGFGKYAGALIDRGYISKAGEILRGIK